MVDLREDGLSTYLHYGYFPRVPSDFAARPWARVRRADVRSDGAVARGELVARGLAAFRAACAEPGPGPHLVPLSGGLDSRFLLAILLELGLRERIVTVTFGVPGALDFELAERVARVAGVAHERLVLAGPRLSRAELDATAEKAPWGFVFEAHFNHELARRHGQGATCWSGIFANVTTGKDLDFPETTWAAAAREFAVRSRLLRGRDLCAPGFDPVAALPGEPILADSALAWLEQLYAFLRFPGRLDPALLAPGFAWRTPFRAPAWIDFILRVPRSVRADPGFYRAIAASSAPGLFALPTKNDHGLAPGSSSLAQRARAWRHKLGRGLARLLPGRIDFVNPSLNYADLDRELRADGDLSRVITEALEGLARRRLVTWLDPLELLRRHRARRENLGEHLALLASLEIQLAREEHARRSGR
jgi:hypothetical protein